MVWVFCFVLTGNKPPKYSSQIQRKTLNQHFFNLGVEDWRRFPDSPGKASTQAAVTQGHHSSEKRVLPSHHTTHTSPRGVGLGQSSLTQDLATFWGSQTGDRAAGLLEHTELLSVLRRKLASFPCVQDMCPPPFYHSSLQMPCQCNAHFNSESLIAILIFNFLPL